MKLHQSLFAATLCGTTLLAAASPWQETPPSKPNPNQPGATQRTPPARPARTGSSMGTAYRETLNALSGTWNVSVKTFPASGAGADASAAMEATGTSTRTWILDGKILQEQVRCNTTGKATGQPAVPSERTPPTTPGMRQPPASNPPTPETRPPSRTPPGPNDEIEQERTTPPATTPPVRTTPPATPPRAEPATPSRRSLDAPATDAFEGEGMFGYDSTDGEFVHVWADNTDSKLAFSTGSFDQVSKTFTFTKIDADQSMPSRNLQPQEGNSLGDAVEGKNARIVLRIVSNDRHVVEYFAPGAGDGVKLMEITYNRAR